jgi:hypothetical protein
MKKKYLLFIIIFYISFFNILANTNQAIATVTEFEGTVEIKKGGGGETLNPLQHVFHGDVIRVSTGGKAVLMYLGASVKTITHKESPYTLKNIKMGHSQTQKAVKKLKNVILGIVQKGKSRTTRLNVRNIKDRIKIIQPAKSTLILSPKDYIHFKWEPARPPYRVQIYMELGNGDQRKVYEKELHKTNLKLPGTLFKESKTYSWIVFSEWREETGMFQLMSQADSKNFLSELSDIMARIPKENQITRFVIQYGMYIDKGLFYDAQQLYAKIHNKYPKNKTIKKLKTLY